MRDIYRESTDLKILQSLNKHLPSKRKNLSTLLREERPGVVGKDGSSQRFKRSELEQIAEIIQGKYHDRVRLPIYIEMMPDYGRGTAMVRGHYHCKIVQSVLEVKEEKTEKMIIYRPDIRRLRRILPTTTQYAFYMSGINLTLSH
ncbi:MAG: DUF61 family protein [Halobacteriota archaeon]|nr:DUF61 family protein [Halobacteriota archaeon]